MHGKSRLFKKRAPKPKPKTVRRQSRKEVPDQLHPHDILQRSYFRNFPSVPFLPLWQIVMTFMTTMDLAYSLYLANFSNPNPRFPEVKTVVFMTPFLWILLIIAQCVFMIDFVALVLHKYNKYYRTTSVYNPVSSFYLITAFIALITDFIAAVSDLIAHDSTSDILIFPSYLLHLFRILSALRMLRIYTIFRNFIRSVYLSNICVLLLFLAIICQLLVLVAVLFTHLSWSKVPREAGASPSEALYNLIPAMNELSLETWKTETQFDMFLRALYIGSNALLFRGQICLSVNGLMTSFLTQVTVFCNLIYTLMIISVFTIIMKHKSQKSLNFTAQGEKMANILECVQLPAATLKRANEWHDSLWHRRGGVANSEIKKMLHEGLYRDCVLDTYWPAFKHSHLFRNRDIGFLSQTAQHMKTVYHCAGDIIYQKGMMRHSMYHIIQGVVHVMSLYDNTTPIMSFYPGACFGGSTLVTAKPCAIKLACATYCQLQVLERVDFYKLLQTHPREFRSIVVDIQERYNRAILLFTMKQFKKTDHTSIGIYTAGSLTRIKRVSKSIDKHNLAKDIASVRHEEKTPLFQIKPTKVVYSEYVGACSNYFDEIVISDKSVDVENGEGISCITSTFPFILHPNSPFIEVWNFVITSVILIILLTIPCEAGVNDTIATWQMVLSVVLQSLLVMDLLFQCTFAVFLKDKSFTSVESIFYYRLKTWQYKADIIGSIPMNYVIVFYGMSNSNLWGLLKINYVARAWRVDKIIKSHIQRAISYRHLYLIVVYMAYFFVIVSYWGMLLNLMSSFNNDSRDNMWSIIERQTSQVFGSNVVKKSITYTLLLSFGKGGVKIIPYTYLEHMAVMLLNIFNFFLHCYFMAGGMTVTILMMKSKGIYREKVISILELAKNGNLPKTLRYSIYKYLKIMHKNEDDNVFRGSSDLKGLSNELINEVKLNAWGSYLLKIPLFANTEKKFIYSIAEFCEMAFYPQNEVICYSGMLPHSLYIIKQGYCRILSETGMSEGAKGPGWSFGVLECTLEIPVIKTIKTLTSCELIVIQNKHLHSVLQHYPDITKSIESTKQMCPQLFELPEIESTVVRTELDEESKSVYNFGYDMVVGSKAEKEFRQPYDKVLGGFSFVKYLLLRTVFLPSGNAVWVIEISRSIIGILSSILFPSKFILIQTFEYHTWLFTFLDLFGYFDMYLHFHVAYYNDVGVLVIHPLMTAIHYVKSTFVIDMLSVFPFERVFAKLFTFPMAPYWLCYNRVLQVHRVYGLLNYGYQRSIQPDCTIVIIKMVILFLVSVNLCASVAFSLCCIVTDNTEFARGTYTSRGVNCPDIEYNPILFGVIITSTKMYLLFQFYTAALLTQTNYVSFGDWDKSRTITITICFFSYILLIYMYSQIATCIFFQHAGIRYQGKVNRLASFLEKYNVSKDLQHEFQMYYNLLWECHQGQNPTKTIQIFNLTVRNDVMHYIYGQNLRYNTIFVNASRVFFQSLSMSLIPEVHYKNSIIQEEGFIHDNTYILHEGYIKVLVGQRLVMTLGKGAIFGNLYSVEHAQQTITIVAHSYAEVLKMPAKKFYSIIDGYPHSKLEFDMHLKIAARKGICIIPGFVNGEENVVKDEEITINKKESLLISTRVEIFKATLSLITSICNLYVITTAEFTLGGLFMCVLLDFLTLFAILANCFTPYKDSDRNYVCDVKKTKRNYRKRYDGLLFDMITIFPFEVVSFLFTKKKVYAYFYFRVNRVLRYVPFNAFLYKQESEVIKKQSSKALLLKVFNVYLFVFALVCVEVWAISLFGISCVAPEELTFFDRLVVFSHLLVTKFCSICDYPIQFVLPCNAKLLVMCELVQMILGEVFKAVLLGHFVYYTETYLNDVLFFMQTRLDVITELKTHRVAVYLVKQAEAYLKYLWDNNNGAQLPEVLELAPTMLKVKLKKMLFQHHLTNHDIFAKCGEKFLDHLAYHFQIEVISPGSIIVRKGTRESKLYFIHSGQVLKYKHENDLTIITEPRSFGCLSLNKFDIHTLHQKAHLYMSFKYSYKAITRVTMAILEFNSWSYLLTYFPREERIMRAMIKIQEEGVDPNKV